MDGETKASKEMSAYKVIRFAGKQLPENYKGVVFSRWLRSLRYGNDYFKLIDSGAYFSNYHLYIERLLLAPDTTVNLAVLAEDEDVVLGWSVNREQVLDYVHVQKDYRGLGVGRSLILAEVKVISHLTKTGLSIWSAKFPKAHFNPF